LQAELLPVLPHDPKVTGVESYRHIGSLQRRQFGRIAFPFPCISISNEKSLIDLKAEIEVHDVDGLAIVMARREKGERVEYSTNFAC
jgi:hypothetical protein